MPETKPKESTGARYKRMGKRVLMLYLDPELHDAIERLAQADQRSKSAWARIALEAAVKQAEGK